MKRIWKYIKENFKLYLVIIFLLLAVDAGQLIMPMIIRSAINNIETIKNVRLLYISSIYLVIISFLIVLARYIYNSLIRKLALNFEYQTNLALFKKYLSLPDSFFHTHEIGDLMARVNNDTRSLRRFLVMGLISAIDVVFLGISSIVMMIFLSPRLTLLIITPLSCLILLTTFVSPQFRKVFRRLQDTFGEMTTRVRESLIGIKVIRTFVRENFYSKLFNDVCTAYLKINITLGKNTGLFEPSIMLLVNISMLLIYLFGGKMVINGNLTLGTLVAFTQYIQTLSWPMMAFGFIVNLYQRANISLKRIEEILTTQSSDQLQKIKIYPKLDVVSLKVKDLSFCYPDSRENLVLKGINFEVKRGEILGLTGPTGSGKTTLISLILRIWEPPSKTIFLDDYDITTIDLDLYRKNFAYVSQESFLFSASLRENLAFGKPSASDEEIIKFAKLACIWEDIEKLENGLDTTVGERGITLSGGQKQRVAIARALIAGNPILILDDPLSAVDSETEQKIIINLKEYLKEKDLICIIISHRIAALSWANKIGVIKNGKLAEYGTHLELLEKKCYYYHIYRQQYLEGLKALNNHAG